MRTLKPRIVVTINEGLVEVAYEGFDASAIELVTIDYDTDGCDPKEDGLYKVGGELAWFSVGEMDTLDDETAKAVSLTWDHWASTEGPQ